MKPYEVIIASHNIPLISVTPSTPQVGFTLLWRHATVTSVRFYNEQ